MKKTLLLLNIALVLFQGCSLGPTESVNSNELTIATWNVQNLFDGKDDGTEYEEYTSSHYWSDSLYRLRLSDVETVLNYEGLCNADVIVLNEVENENVIADILALKTIKQRGFKYYACAGEENGAIKTAVISTIPMMYAKLHAVENARPIIEIKFNTQRPFYLLALHAKSRVGTAEETSKLRLFAGITVAEIQSLIEREEPNALIVVAGDMNEDWKDANSMVDVRQIQGKITNCPLIVSGNKNDKWYCFWLDETLSINQTGSYYYNGNWSCFDNILISDATRVVSAGVVNNGILRKSDRTPNAWIRNTASGVSDHFPVWVSLEFEVILF